MQLNQAQPFPYHFELKSTALVIIDMQRDFIEPGGFGETLGNDVSLLQAIVPTCKEVLTAWRTAGGLVVHTREAHRADLSDCPPAKRNRGNPSLRIGDMGAMGRILIAGEPGNQIIAALAPLPGEIVIDKPGKGAFYATPLHELLQQEGAVAVQPAQQVRQGDLDRAHHAALVAKRGGLRQGDGGFHQRDVFRHAAVVEHPLQPPPGVPAVRGIHKRQIIHNRQRYSPGNSPKLFYTQ